MKARAISRVSSFVNLGESRPCAFGCTLWAYVLYAVFLTLTKYCCAAFACVEIEPGVHVLAADPDVQCYVGDHIAIMFFGAVGFVVYVFGCAAMVQNPTLSHLTTLLSAGTSRASQVPFRDLRRPSKPQQEQIARNGRAARPPRPPVRQVRCIRGPRSRCAVCMGYAAKLSSDTHGPLPFRKLHRRRGYSQVQSHRRVVESVQQSTLAHE
jgi:hypothetical protein